MRSGQSCGFLAEGGKSLIHDMAGVWLLATRHPHKLFGGQLEPEPLHVAMVENFFRLDFRQIRPTRSFRGHLRRICREIDPTWDFLTRHLVVVAGVERFDWPTETARVTATAFTAARGLMRHGHFFDLTIEWIESTQPERMAHMQKTLVPFSL